MEQINKVKSISIWIFIVPFFAVNACLILITQFQGLFPNQEDIKNDEDDEFEDWGNDNENDEEKYWFTKNKIDKIASVHNYLDSLPQVGKVLSFSSIIDVATMLNNNKALGSLEMGVLYSKIPDNIKTEIVDPYISILSLIHI